ncbi:MAG: fimbrillin family protein [Bacteroidaceae bacterium]|nr:fimbrillin family protein [Bacteroidaceae bacterium]
MKNIALSIISLSLLAACSSELAEMENDIVTGDEVQKVTIQSHPFVFDDDTRTLLTASDKSINFSWADYDAMGVFPVAPYSNSQAKRTLSVPAGADAHYATFDGAGWELSQNNTYAAYVPYNGSLPSSTLYDEVPVDLTGQDGTLETIGKKYDYMYAPSSRGTFKNLGGKNTEIVFDFQHAVSIIQLKLTMPIAAEWKSVTLASTDGSKVWTTSAAMNVATGEVIPKETSSEVTLSLDNVSTTESDKTLTLYLAVLPTTTGDLTLTAKTSVNRSYTATLTAKTLVAGKAYRYTKSEFVTPPTTGTENGYTWVDLNLPSGLKWATMNVGATSVADYGKYYAWGETKGYGEEDQSNARNYVSAGSYTKTSYSWNTYKWSNDDEGNSFSKYTASSNTTLDAEDDAATQNWGGAWRMPTHAEQEELVNNCYWVWTLNYNGSGVEGCIVYAAKYPSDCGLCDMSENSSKNYSLSDTHIFIPAAGYRFLGGSDSNFDSDPVVDPDFNVDPIGKNRSSYGKIWSSSLTGDDGKSAWSLDFCTMRIGWIEQVVLNSDNLDGRYKGFSVRAVCK